MVDFLDKVKLGISKGVATATVKSKEMIEVTRLQSRINTIRDQKRNAIEELGNIVYTMFLKDGIDETRIKDRVGAIQKIDYQIGELENEILQVQNKARESLGFAACIGKCACGADLFEDTKFCGGCGKKVDASPTSVASEGALPTKIVCNQCSAVLSDDAKFCSVCGAKTV